VTRPLLADVARAAGVSVSTASRVLAGRGELRATTRAKVLEAASALGYEPGGRGASRPAARHVDLVMHPFEGRWAGEVSGAVRSAASERGLDLVLTDDRDDAADDWSRRIVERGSRGAILAVLRPTSAQRARLRSAGIPLVLLEPRSEEKADVPVVRATDGEGAAAAADHLVARGAERFAVAVTTPAYRFGRARAQGFLARLAAVRPGTQAQVIAVGSDAATARAALRPVVADAAGARLGLFATTDELAVQVYRVAAELGRRIPDDVLVCGFDDVPGSSFMVPPLTTVHQPMRRMADGALDALLYADTSARLIALPTTLVVRGST
jgi:LacI family transcriptional regulator